MHHAVAGDRWPTGHAPSGLQLVTYCWGVANQRSPTRKDTRPWVVRHSWVVVSIGGVLAAICLVIAFVYPAWFTSSLDGLTGRDRADVLADGRDFGLKLAAGAGAVAGAILTWGRFEMSKEQADLDREKADLDRARIDSERFGQAIEQIGSNKPDVVLGGLYALEALGTAAPAYRGQITEVLGAFIREHTADRSGSPSLRPLAIAERTALTILGRQHVAWVTTIDLTGTRLSEADLSRTDLSRAELSRAELSRADLTGTDLTRARLFKADLTGARLFRSELTGANLRGADLREAVLSEARLTEADLTEARLTGADLTGARLAGAVLSRADLAGVNLTGTDLTGAKLDANFDRATVISDSRTVWPDS